MPIDAVCQDVQQARAADRWLAVSIWVLFAAGVFFSLARTIGKSNDYQDLDFGAFYRGATAVRFGETPYVVDEYGPLGSYVYGPAWAFAAIPLSYLNYLWACRVWTVVNWLCAAGCVAIAVHLVFGNGRRPRWIWRAVWLTVIPTASYFWSGIRVGQLGLLMAVLYFVWAFCIRHRQSFCGGLCLAAAAGLKLAPGFLVPYFLVRRDWRGLAGVAVGATVLFLIPACWVGIDGSVRLHLEWAAHCRNTQVVEQTYRPENQSLIGELARLPPISNGHTLGSPENLANLGSYYPFLVLAVSGAVYGTIAWRHFRTPASLSHDAENLHIAVLFVTMTLIHPRAWTCNFVSLALPCAMLARTVIAREAGWSWALTALVLLTGVCAAPKVGPVADWVWWRWLLQGKDFCAAILVVSICGWCRCVLKPTSVKYQQARAA